MASVIAVPLSGGSSLALLNAAAACTDVAISELDEEINGVWAAMTEEERNAHKVGYRAWGNFRDVWHIGTAAVAIRGGAKVLKHFAGLLRFNTRFNNFVKSGSSFFAAISKKTFGKPFAVFNQRMGRFVGWGVNGAGKFTLRQIDDYVALATNVGKGVNKDKILLGEFIDGSPNSYVTRAKNEGYTYFDMGDKWDEAFNLVNKSKDEMWEINKKFIDEQKALNKNFYFSQEPWNFPSTPKTFRFREAEYLIDMGAKDFKKINDNTWKVIW